MKKVLITGVAGMIGSHLLDALLEKGGYRIIGLDNFSFGKEINILHNLGSPQFQMIQGDVLDEKKVEKLSEGVDIILHLAAVKKIVEADSSLPTLMINTRGTENILEAARKNSAKVILASTSDVYGMSPDLPFREDGDLLLGPSMIKRWSYAVSKLYDEQLTFGYHHDYDLPVVVLRYFGGFSPRSRFKWSGGHVPIFVDAILNDKEVLIHGDGSQTRSMAYVTDLVRGTVVAMEEESAVGEIINLGNNEEMGVLDTARLIQKVSNTGKKLKLKFVPFGEIFGKYKDIMRRVPDLTKAMKLLGYSPQIPMEEAIRLMIEQIRKVKSNSIQARDIFL